ncbi:MAG: TetR/AcrR family transcriptional regulator [Prevotellaceae bacterium]|jgi:AcrR family transcriptional regulator|nr:TetR/AcrR family transcriptional regulator [Prevotellaceae bacterium]
MITSRNKIIEEAARLFMINGYKGCRTVEVAEFAGLSNNSGLFRYFKTKAEMYYTVVERYIVNMQKPKDKFGNCSHLSLKDFIEHYIDVVGKSMTNVHTIMNAGDKTANRYFSFALESGYKYKECSKAILNFGTEEIELWHKVIEKAQKANEISSDINPYHAAKLFRYAFMGLSYTFAIENGVSIEQVREALYEIYDMIKK